MPDNSPQISDVPGARSRLTFFKVMAFIVGVGLPQIGVEQNALRDYYEDTMGMGFEYAYQYPGMSKVLQAAGRIIRTETDRGALLLIDTRYSLSDYRALLPTHWKVERVRHKEELADKVSAFWKEPIG